MFFFWLFCKNKNILFYFYTHKYINNIKKEKNSKIMRKHIKKNSITKKQPKKRPTYPKTQKILLLFTFRSVFFFLFFYFIFISLDYLICSSSTTASLRKKKKSFMMSKIYSQHSNVCVRVYKCMSMCFGVFIFSYVFVTKWHTNTHTIYKAFLFCCLIYTLFHHVNINHAVTLYNMKKYNKTAHIKM